MQDLDSFPFSPPGSLVGLGEEAGSRSPGPHLGGGGSQLLDSHNDDHAFIDSGVSDVSSETASVNGRHALSPRHLPGMQLVLVTYSNPFCWLQTRQGSSPNCFPKILGQNLSDVAISSNRKKIPLAKNRVKVELPGRVFQAIQAQLWSNFGQVIFFESTQSCFPNLILSQIFRKYFET